MENDLFRGKYCSGIGDGAWLKLIDDSLSVITPTADRPNITMLYNPDGDTFKEGFIWGNGFWIQNGYGFVTGVTPFLSKPWSRVLQNTLDLHWNNMGDGKRIGMHSQIPHDELHCANLCAPDGSLGDVVFDDMIVYKQGDGNVDEYDWFYEATAAGLNMEADMLLASHDAEKAKAYMPKLLRSINFIEGARDEATGLFLVGPACNLLAPSYGAKINPKTKEIEKCYLTGISVTYGAALAKLEKVARLICNKALAADFASKRQITQKALEQLKTDEGYFLKFRETDGTPHGQYGNEKYGYLDGVCNIDAIAFGIANDSESEKIYQKIASIPQMRPFDFLCNNYPALDDNLQAYRGQPSPFGVGDWVDGGCWGTVEGRAMLAYTRLGKFDDAFRSSLRNMKWTDDYRMDEPYGQWGENKYNQWQKETKEQPRGPQTCQTGIMIDNFAIPTCLLRGLLGISYTDEAVCFTPHFPSEIESYTQNMPVWFGGKKIYVTVHNGKVDKTFTIPYSALPDCASVILDLSTGELSISAYTEPPVEFATLGVESDENLKKMLERYESLKGCPESEYAIFLKDAILSNLAAKRRRELPFHPGYFRPMNEKKKAEIISIYDTSCGALLRGLKNHIYWD